MYSPVTFNDWALMCETNAVHLQYFLYGAIYFMITFINHVLDIGVAFRIFLFYNT